MEPLQPALWIELQRPFDKHPRFNSGLKSWRHSKVQQVISLWVSIGSSVFSGKSKQNKIKRSQANSGNCSHKDAEQTS